MPVARTHRLRPRAPPGAGARRRPPQRDRGRGRTRRRGGTRSGRLGVSARETGAAALGPSPVPPGPRAARGLGDPRPAVSQTGGPACTAGGPRARGRPCPVRRHLPLSRDPRPARRAPWLPFSSPPRCFPGAAAPAAGARSAGLAPRCQRGPRRPRTTGDVGASGLSAPHPEGPGARPRPGLRTDAARVSRRSERCRVTLSRRESLRRRFSPPAAQQVTQFTSRSLEEGPPLAVSSGPGSGWSPWPLSHCLALPLVAARPRDLRRARRGPAPRFPGACATVLLGVGPEALSGMWWPSVSWGLRWLPLVHTCWGPTGARGDGAHRLKALTGPWPGTGLGTDTAGTGPAPSWTATARAAVSPWAPRSGPGVSAPANALLSPGPRLPVRAAAQWGPGRGQGQGPGALFPGCVFA